MGTHALPVAISLVTLLGFAEASFGQADTAPPVSDAFVNGILDQYAPGVRQQIAESRRLADSATRPETPAVPRVSASPAATSADAARERAQRFLDQYSPGIVTLGADGVRVDVPGVAIETGVEALGDSVAPTALHRLAMSEAASAFRAGDQARAERWIGPVVAELPCDSDVRQLQSMIHLRGGDLQAAADAARAALESAPAWQIEQLMSLFPRPAAYDELLRKLPAEPDGHALFLLAYHALIRGRLDEAQALLDRAEETLPEGFISPTVRARFAAE